MKRYRFRNIQIIGLLLAIIGVIMMLIIMPLWVWLLIIGAVLILSGCALYKTH